MGVVMTTSLFSQSELKVFEDWTTTAGTQHFFHRNVTQTDISGNVFVAGATMNSSGNYDILVAKYNSGGVQQWIRQINGDGNYQDFATALYVTDSGTVYVTGAITNDSTLFLSDLFVLKLNASNGTTTWLETYDGDGNLFDTGTDIEVGVDGIVYVVGSGFNSSINLDIITLSYTSVGSLNWSSLHDYMGGNDAAVNIYVDGGTLYVTGGGQTAPTDYDALGYELGTDGSLKSSYANTGGSPGVDTVNDITKDINGNIYIAGGIPTVSDGYDMYLVKLDSNLVVQWEATYNGSDDLDDIANGVKVDSSGNVYITGYTTSSTARRNCITIKYDNTGDDQWTMIYNDTLNGDDEGMSIELDANEDIIVAGYDSTAINNLDYYSIKYNSAGTEIWNIRSDGNDHLSDKVTNMAIDDNGDIIVTGASKKFDGSMEYKTVKYVEKQTINPVDFAEEPMPSGLLYYANKGQLIGSDSALVPDVRFYTNSTYPMYYFKDDTMSMVFAHIDTIPGTTDTLHKINVTFENCNEPTRIYPLEEQDSYLNYFLTHCSEGVTEIYGNQKLVVHDLYYNIDLVYSSNPNGMKYYFVVKPGGDPDDIKMQYTGASSTNLSSNILSIRGIRDTVSFDRPFMYQINSSNDTILNSDYFVNWHNYTGNKYGIDVHAYDSTKVMIIQIDQGNAASPTSTGNLDWSTYYGSGGEFLFDIKTDASGKVYATGYAISNAFPTSAGVIFGSSIGGDDAVAIKFQADGAREWATFYGGTAGDQSNAITTDASGNVYLTGYSKSTNFPTASPFGEYLDNSNTCSGGGCTPMDLFIVRLSSKGNNTPIPHWGTYYGGVNGSDRGLDIAIDGANKLFVVGSGDNTTPLVSSGSYNYSTGGGLIMEFNSSRSLTWASFTGGSSAGAWVKGIDFDNSNNIYLTGYIRGTGYPILNPGAGATFGGGVFDAVITKLATSSHSLLWSSYYGGANDDVANRIKVDPASSTVYITGRTSSTASTFPLLDPGGLSYYQGALSGNDDVFIAQFRCSNGVLTWSTYYGGTGNEEGNDIDVDAAGDVFVTGNTYSSDFPFPTPNLSGGYNIGTMSGSADAFVVGFKASLENVWATYFGGTGLDFGYGCATYQNSKFYITGATSSTSSSFPLDNGGGTPYFDGTSGLGNWGFVSRFDLPSVAYSISEIESNISSLFCYPNPSSNLLNISFQLESKSEVQLELVNLLGQVVKEEQYLLNPGKVEKTISVSDIQSGAYFLQIRSVNNFASIKFIKQ